MNDEENSSQILLILPSPASVKHRKVYDNFDRDVSLPRAIGRVFTGWDE